jgi:hypothetical protein
MQPSEKPFIVGKLNAQEREPVTIPVAQGRVLGSRMGIQIK